MGPTGQTGSMAPRGSRGRGVCRAGLACRARTGSRAHPGCRAPRASPGRRGSGGGQGRQGHRARWERRASRALGGLGGSLGSLAPTGRRAPSGPPGLPWSRVRSRSSGERCLVGCGPPTRRPSTPPSSLRRCSRPLARAARACDSRPSSRSSRRAGACRPTSGRSRQRGAPSSRRWHVWSGPPPPSRVPVREGRAQASRGLLGVGACRGGGGRCLACWAAARGE
mmetsp:Transcript_2199/g.4893  ORF Transcript_2199/g.4893 Transcript_2199/m.4893 type:complete len:224 (-) Transcript_2199:33-704(-)